MMVLMYTIASWVLLRSISLYVIITLYLVTGGELNTEITFTTMSLVLYLCLQMGTSVTGILEFADGVVALVRISVRVFLRSECEEKWRRLSHEFVLCLRSC